MNKTPTVNEICDKLKELSKNTDDIYILSIKADGKVDAYICYNKGDGRDGSQLTEFNNVEDILFIDTVNKEKTSLTKYFKDHLFNASNGDGEAIFCYEARTKTMNMICVHNSNLGPALGGFREKDYSTFDSMLTDTLRLAKGMTYKAAVAGTDSGGGKATRTVPKGLRREANLAAGRMCNFVNIYRKKRGLNLYVIAEDSNTNCHDMDEIFEICSDVSCKSLHVGGTGNPSPVTAIGVYHAAVAGCEFAFPDRTLEGKTVLLTGVGQVGFEVLKNFVRNGTKKVICAEMDKNRIEWVQKQFDFMEKDDRIKFMLYTKEELGNQKFLHDLANEIDIFTPCALGRSINDTNIEAIKGTRLKLICGAENNQLADEEKHGKMLHDIGITYVPDFVANAGGVINCANELSGRMFLISDTIRQAQNVGNTVRAVLSKAQKENIPSYKAANKMAEDLFLS